MSDEEEDEYEYEYDDEDMEEAPFQYTDEEDSQDDAQVALENAYYNAKGLRETSTAEASKAFEKVIQQEQEILQAAADDSNGSDHCHYGPFSFKARKQLVKLHIRARGTEKILQQYRLLLECISVKNSISPNAVEKGIHGMLERIASLYQNSSKSNGNSNSGGGTGSSAMVPSSPGTAAVTSGNNNNDDPNQTLAVAVYDETLQVFHPQTGACKNERLWFKANLKYGQLLYEMNETTKLQKVLKDLQSFQQEQQQQQQASGLSASNAAASSSSSSSSTTSMEIYALQIQLYSRQKDHKRLRETFHRAMAIQGGIPHPRTLALMQELGGKMHMASKEYEAAGKTFFQAFKSYDEAGDPSRLRCLKYLVLASMLHASTINPFDSQEARPYKDDPEIVAMTNLVQAFQNNEIHAFEQILRRNQRTILLDEFIREHIEDLLRTIRRQVLRRVIRPYKRISLQAIARELNDIPVADVESLLVGLILDGSLDGKIDRVDGVLLKQAEKGSRMTGTTATAVASTTGASSGTTTTTSAAASTATQSQQQQQQQNFPNTPLDEQCQVLEDMIAHLEELSTHVTNMRVKDTPMRGMVLG